MMFLRHQRLLTKPNFCPKIRTFQSSLLPSRPAVTTFSEDEEMLRETVSKFSKNVIGPKVKEMDITAKMCPDILKQCFEQGFMSIETPTELKGSGMSFISSCIVIEEMAKVDASVSVLVDVQNTLVNTAIRKWGNEKQHKKYLPKLATDTIGCFALSEWGSGSDAFAMKCIATKKDDYYVLNGTKAWITSSHEAGLFIIMANTDPEKGYKGITAFIAQKENPGLVIGKKEDKLGIRASSTCEVILDNCLIHQSDVLGTVGIGYKIAIESLNEGRIGIGAQMLGLAQGAFDATLAYLNQRKQFGQKVSEFQGVQFEIAKMAMDIEAARVLVYNAARLQETQRPFRLEASYAKLYSSQMAERVASKCVELLGGVGFTKEFPIEKFYRDCKVGQIYEGTTNIQLQTIAKSINQKYREE